MRENRMSGSMRGRRKRALTYRACVLLYVSPWRGSGACVREDLRDLWIERNRLGQ